eukprot:609475-Rhodomonas_salina.2
MVTGQMVFAELVTIAQRHWAKAKISRPISQIVPLPRMKNEELRELHFQRIKRQEASVEIVTLSPTLQLKLLQVSAKSCVSRCLSCCLSPFGRRFRLNKLSHTYPD